MIKHQTLQDIKSLEKGEDDILIRLKERYGCNELKDVTEEQAVRFYNTELLWKTYLNELKEKLLVSR